MTRHPPVQQVAQTQHVSQETAGEETAAMAIMTVQVDVMCCKSVGTDLSMLDIDDLMTEICQLKKEVKLLETKLNRKDVCGVSLCDVTDQTSPDLLHSVCNEEQKTSVKLLDCEMELKTEITEAEVQTEIGNLIYSDPMKVKEERSELNEIKEENDVMTGEESVSCLKTEKSWSPKKSQRAPDTCKSVHIRHTRIHTEKRPYRCDQCGNTFSREYSLNRHMKIHTGERSYKCEQCGKIFIRKDSLNKHMRVHTGEKPYTCDQCGKSFAWADVLRDHLLYHSGVRSFQCEQCNKTFITAVDLKKHMNTHTGVKAHVCSLCGKAFARFFKFKDHMRKKHTGVTSLQHLTN